MIGGLLWQHAPLMPSATPRPVANTQNAAVLLLTF
jgi:hypothetical protein